MSAQYPENELTQMMEAASAMNRGGLRSGVSSTTPPPTARSADLGQEVPDSDPLPPLTPEERAYFDQQARAAGIMDDRLGAPPPDVQYTSLEAAVAAGAPIRSPGITAVNRNPQNVAPSTPRLPDFRRVEGIDLVRNVVRVDGMEFPISATDAGSFKHYVVEIAKEAILTSLDEATSLFALPEPAEDASGGTPQDPEGPQE